MAPSVKQLIPDFGTSNDLEVHGSEPHVVLCADSVKPAWDSLFPSLSLSLPLLCLHTHTVSLFLKINKLKKNSIIIHIEPFEGMHGIQANFK